METDVIRAEGEVLPPERPQVVVEFTPRMQELLNRLVAEDSKPDPVETQDSCHQWCIDLFPQYGGRHNRAQACLEECLELAIAAGVSPKDIRSTVKVVLEKERARAKAGKPTDDKEEAADLLLCLYAYAGEADFDVHTQLDAKMAINRSRPQSYYDGKVQDKVAKGFVLKPTTES